MISIYQNVFLSPATNSKVFDFVVARWFINKIIVEPF